jgi:hypothetical protein
MRNRPCCSSTLLPSTLQPAGVEKSVAPAMIRPARTARNLRITFLDMIEIPLFIPFPCVGPHIVALTEEQPSPPASAHAAFPAFMCFPQLAGWTVSRRREGRGLSAAGSPDKTALDQFGGWRGRWAGGYSGAVWLPDCGGRAISSTAGIFGPASMIVCEVDADGNSTKRGGGGIQRATCAYSRRAR